MSVLTCIQQHPKWKQRELMSAWSIFSPSSNNCLWLVIISSSFLAMLFTSNNKNWSVQSSCPKAMEESVLPKVLKTVQKLLKIWRLAQPKRWNLWFQCLTSCYMANTNKIQIRNGSIQIGKFHYFGKTKCKEPFSTLWTNMRDSMKAFSL